LKRPVRRHEADPILGHDPNVILAERVDQESKRAIDGEEGAAGAP
jgi:hypothetical protein